MNALDVELEVLRKQMEAALKLSEDKSLAKNIRRKHRQTYQDTHRKVTWFILDSICSFSFFFVFSSVLFLFWIRKWSPIAYDFLLPFLLLDCGEIRQDCKHVSIDGLIDPRCRPRTPMDWTVIKCSDRRYCTFKWHLKTFLFSAAYGSDELVVYWYWFYFP